MKILKDDSKNSQAIVPEGSGRIRENPQGFKEFARRILKDAERVPKESLGLKIILKIKKHPRRIPEESQKNPRRFLGNPKMIPEESAKNPERVSKKF